MSKIKIKNFGPIKNGFPDNEGWIDIKKVTVFIGNQGSGKSSVAKLISTMKWIEKVLVRGDYKIEEFSNNSRFRKIYCGYHGIDDYFFDLNLRDIAEIGYKGEAYTLYYQNGKLKIEETQPTRLYELPQTMYVPAERSFISTIRDLKLIKISSDALSEFLNEYNDAKKEIKKSLKLPINDTEIEYDNFIDMIYIKGEDYRVPLNRASSGFQSFVPLYLVSWYLANVVKQQSENTQNMSSEELSRFKRGITTIWADDTLTDEQRRAALSVLSSKFNKTAFINIVEEPEQNLFPSSQRQMLNSLLAFNNMKTGNELILTTHSPYIINYLTLSVKAKFVSNKIGKTDNKQDLNTQLEKIVPIVSTISADDLVIYELDDKGNIIKLDDYKGLPSDDNYLNQSLAESNELFANLLDIEDLLKTEHILVG